jgi:hypothetical protein
MQTPVDKRKTEIKKKLDQVFDERQATVLTEIIGDAYHDLVKSSDFNELKEIVKELGVNLGKLVQAQENTEVRVGELAQAQRKTEIRVGELAQAQKNTEIRLEELAQAQRKTEIRLEELAQAQRKTEVRVGELAQAQKNTEIRLEELAQAQRNTEIRLEELAQAQRKTEIRLEELAQAQKNTEIRLEELAEAQKNTEVRVEELAQALKRTEGAMNLGFKSLSDQISALGSRWGIYNEVTFRSTIRGLLSRQKGVEIRSGYYGDREVDVIISDSEHIILEITSRMKFSDIEKLIASGDDYKNKHGVEPILMVATSYISPKLMQKILDLPRKIEIFSYEAEEN